MTIRRIALVALSLCLALPLHAQTAATPAADLALITQKAAGDRELQNVLQRITQMQTRPSEARMMLENQLMQYYPNGRADPDQDIAYRVLQDVQVAQMRGQYYGQILTSDLNNDGQITKQEVKQTLSVMQVQGAAEAFFSSDANDDNILSPDEIRAAVDRQVGLMQGRRTRTSPMALFDFDDDGVLTAAERTRGVLALGLTDK